MSREDFNARRCVVCGLVLEERHQCPPKREAAFNAAMESDEPRVFGNGPVGCRIADGFSMISDDDVLSRKHEMDGPVSTAAHHNRIRAMLDVPGASSAIPERNEIELPVPVAPVIGKARKKN